MDALDYLATLLLAGIEGLVNYLSAHVLICLVPAFFIAGALSALFKKEAVTKYLGKDTPAYISYPIAAIAGLLIAVCSCTILPLFAGIWKKGAGLGPAVTFLFTGPAINLLAITYTGSLIGWDIAFARGILAVVFGIAIGITMALIFEKANLAFRSRTAPRGAISGGVAVVAPCNPADSPAKTSLLAMLLAHRSSVLFVLLVTILLVGTAPVSTGLKVIGLVAAVAASLAWAFGANTKTENRAWMTETYFFVNLGMAKGPLLAYLLADPELSFQSVLVTGRIMGKKKVAVYVLLVVVCTTAAGLVYGLFAR
jgi:uncharacterized membrane protein YraQ (UPF0718 family)